MTKTKKPFKAKSPSPAISKIAQEARKLRIDQILLFESSSRRGEFKEDKLPTELHQSMGMNVEIMSDTEGKLEDIAIATVKASVWACYKGDGPEKSAFEVRATFKLFYTFIEQITKGVSAEDTVKTIAVMNIFPYWREFVQSTTVRMGLPALTIPIADVARVSASMQKISDDTKKVN